MLRSSHWRIAIKIGLCNIKISMINCIKNTEFYTTSMRRLWFSWKSSKRRPENKPKMMWRRWRTNLFRSGRHLRKKELCMRWKRSIWRKNSIDTKRGPWILRINVENSEPATPNSPPTSKNSKTNTRIRNKRQISSLRLTLPSPRR